MACDLRQKFSSETTAIFSQTTRVQIPEDSVHRSHGKENTKCYWSCLSYVTDRYELYEKNRFSCNAD